MIVLTTFLFYSCGKSDKNAVIINDQQSNANTETQASQELSETKPEGALDSRKLIKDIFLSLQTTQFDRCVEIVRTDTSEKGGYIQNSDVTGNAYDNDSYRYASLVLRIPADKTQAFLNDISQVGKVTSQQENIKDVTMEYIDVESRLKALKTEEESLIALLKKADSVNNIITIQDRLSEVRGQIESYEAQIRSYDNLVAYNTVTLTINEVQRVDDNPQGTFAKIKNNLIRNFAAIGEGFQSGFIGIVSALPYIFLAAVILLVIFLIVRKCLQKKKNKKKCDRENNSSGS